MIVKDVINEELITLPEVKDLLIHQREKRKQETAEEIELGYELRKAIAHVEIFSKLDAKQSRELVDRLLELEKMKPEIAVRIADILPLSNDEIRSIYAKERYTLTEEELKQILDLVLQYT
ncbi:MAG: RNA polymerase Rpb4 family protein [Candidatus Methanoperedenaceae archaeon]|nr:RNA polymerase Rpb4 family protein [Candidatus Methanoperedenaceae archaeon]MDW7727230.1 RNA polymerase Rpb4 family protein [Candidatus Methanoperedens sp.]